MPLFPFPYPTLAPTMAPTPAVMQNHNFRFSILKRNELKIADNGTDTDASNDDDSNARDCFSKK